MQAKKRGFARTIDPALCRLLDMIHIDGGANPLRQIASPIMGLEKKPPLIAWARRQATMPNVGNKQGDITRFGEHGFDLSAVIVKIDILKSVYRWEPARFVAAWDDTRRS